MEKRMTGENDENVLSRAQVTPFASGPESVGNVFSAMNQLHCGCRSNSIS
jgi:hypothetical protein